MTEDIQRKLQSELDSFKNIQKGETERAVKFAIDVGYRHIDCAAYYRNEHEVGTAIKQKICEGVIKREDIFVTGKLWNNSNRPDLVEKALRRSLSDLQLEYLDLYLVHWPHALKEELQKAINTRQQLDSQLNENEIVKNELNLLPDDGRVYKSVGPVLIKTDLVEAKQNVGKRIDYIGKELKKVDELIASMEKKQDNHRESLAKLQQQFQQAQVKAALHAPA